jgi:AcrR family transcriptional regulator
VENRAGAEGLDDAGAYVGGAVAGKRRAPVRYRKLKPRPGGSGKEVAEHQCGRIQAATIELVAERGYNALTVAAIVRAAGVSKHTFYEHFDDKEDCFLATYDRIVRVAAREVLAAQLGERGWEEQLREAFAAFAREVAEKPQAAWLALVEAFAAGPAAFERMRHTGGLFEALVAESFAKIGDRVELPTLVVKGIVAGVARVGRARLLAGREHELPEEAGELMRWALSLRSPVVAKACCRVPPRQSPQPSSVPPRAPAQSHPVDRGELLGDERCLLLSATAKLAAREGYEALTVPRIRETAGLSRRSFDTHFDGVADCFLATLELYVGRALAAARVAFLSAETWPAGVHRALTALCTQIAADPTLVRLAFFEFFAGGPQAMHWHARNVAKLGTFLCASAPPGQRPTELEAEASIGAGWAVLHHYATTDRAEALPGVVGVLSYLVLAPAVGAEAATEVIRVEQTRNRRPVADPVALHRAEV